MSLFTDEIRKYTNTLYNFYEAKEAAKTLPLMGASIYKDLNTLIDLTNLSMLDYINRMMDGGDWEIYNENGTYKAMHTTKAIEIAIGRIDSVESAVDACTNFMRSIADGLDD